MISLLLVLLAAAPAESTQTLVERANAHMAAGNFAAAADALNQALATDPDDVDILYAAAMAAERSGRTEALTLLEHLLALDPNADEARLQLALVQWRRGNTAAANQAVAYVLARHPDLPAAVAVQQQIAAAPAGPPSPWQLNGRLDLALGYDSNLGLATTALPQASRRGVGVGLVDIAVGTSYRTNSRPFAAFARLTSLQPLNDRAQSAPNAATVVGLGAIGRHYVSDIETVLDVRYDEVFTDSFGQHRERIIAPTLSGAMPVGPLQRLRLLLGGDYHGVFSSPEAIDGSAPIEPNNMVARVGLRDTLALDNGSLAIDVLGRRAWPLATAASGGGSGDVDFLELGGQLYGELHLTPIISAVTLGGLAARTFSDKARPAERSLVMQAGLRASFDFIELHAEYAYSRNDSSSDLWRWQRHSLFAGIRAYTP